MRKITTEESAYIARLYRRYYQTLLRFLQRMGLSETDADDIAQESFYRISRKPDFVAIEQPRAFLFRTAVNLVADLKRRETRRSSKQHIDIDTLEPAELGHVSPSLEQVVEGKQSVMLLRAALSELSPKCLDVFTMFKFEGRSQAQIARELSVSVSMVEKYVIQALKLMRSKLESAEKPESTIRLVESGSEHSEPGGKGK